MIWARRRSGLRRRDRVGEPLHLRYGLSYRIFGELLAERGIEVDHVTEYRWVQRFTPLIVDAARPCRTRSVTVTSSTRST